MRFIVRQKIFSFGDSFNITDEMGSPRYRVQGKFLSIGKKLDIYDMNDQHLVHIKQEIFRFLPEYYLYENDEITAKIKKQFTFLIPKVDIESQYGNFTIDGSVFAYNFTVSKDGKVVADVNKEFLSFSDTYGVDVYDENVDFILALVIVIDQIFHDNRNKG
nr:LURP-one-related family protein [Tissierella sp.]